MLFQPLLFVNNTTQTYQCVCVWIPAWNRRFDEAFEGILAHSKSANMSTGITHTLGSISPNSSTVFWCLILSAPLTQLWDGKKRSNDISFTNTNSEWKHRAYLCFSNSVHTRYCRSHFAQKHLNDHPFFKMSLGNGAMVCLKHKKILIIQPLNCL